MTVIERLLAYSALSFDPNGSLLVTPVSGKSLPPFVHPSLRFENRLARSKL